MTSRQQLRSHIRRLRRSLSAEQQHQASLDLVQQLLPRPEVQQAQHIALYLTNDGELDTTPLDSGLMAARQKLVPAVIASCRAWLSGVSALYPNDFVKTQSVWHWRARAELQSAYALSASWI